MKFQKKISNVDFLQPFISTSKIIYHPKLSYLLIKTSLTVNIGKSTSIPYIQIMGWSKWFIIVEKIKNHHAPYFMMNKSTSN